MNKTSQDTTHSNLLLALSSATAEYEYPAKDKNTTRKSCVFISNDFLFSYEKVVWKENVPGKNLKQ